MKNLKTIAIVLFAALLGSTTAMAGEGSKAKTGIDLKFVGSVENQPVFQLNVNNTEEDEYTVTFHDEQNNLLYAGRLKGTNISKNFQLSTEESSDGVLSVEVRSKKTNKAEVYKINRTHSFTEEIVVNKL